MDVFSVAARITLDSSSYNAGLGEAKKETSSFAGSAKKKLGAIATAAASALSAATTAVAGFTASAITTGASFDAAMSEVKAISGATGGDFDSLRDKAKEMGAKTKYSATESAEAFKYMAMAGWKTEDMLDGIEPVMNLAAASGEDLATTSDILTDALTGFGLTAKDAGHFADVLATASTNANTDVGMMGETFKYVAPVAGSLGYKAEDVAESIGLMANAGIKSSQAGTSLRSIMTRLSTDAGASSKSLGALGILTEKLGVQFYNSDGTVRDFNDVISESREAWKGLTAEEQQNYAKKIAGVNAISGWNALMNASSSDVEKLEDALANCTDEVTGYSAAAEMAATMNDNLAGDVTIAKSAIEGAQIAISDKIAPALRSFVQEGTEGIAAFTEKFENGDFSGAMETAGEAVGGLAIKAVEYIPKMVAAGAQLIAGMVKGIGEKLPELINKGIEAVKNLADGIPKGMPTLLGKALPMIVSFTAKLREGAGKLVDAGLSLVKSLVQGLVNSLPTLIENVPTIVSNIANIINDNAPKILQAGIWMIKTLVTGIINSIPTVVENIPQIITAIVDVWSAFSWIDLGKNALNLIKSGFEFLKEAVPNALKSIGESAKGLFSGIDWKGLGSSAVSLIKTGLEFLKEAIPNTLKAIGNTAKSLFRAIDWKNLGKSVINLIKSGISALVKAIPNALKAIGSTALNLFKKIDWKGLGKTVITLIGKGIAALVNSIPKALKSIGSTALNGFKKIDWKGLGKAVIELVKSGIGAVVNIIPDAIKGIGDKAKSLFSGVKWKETGENATKKIKGGVSSVSSSNDSVENAIKKTGTDAKSKFDSVKWKETGQDAAKKIKSGVSTISSANDSVENAIKKTGTDAKSKFDSVKWKETGEAATTKIASGVATKKGEVTAKFGTTAATGSMIYEIHQKFSNNNWGTWTTIGNKVATHIASGIAAKKGDVTAKFGSSSSSGSLIYALHQKFSNNNWGTWTTIGNKVATHIASGIAAKKGDVTAKFGGQNTYGSLIYDMYQKFASNSWGTWSTIGENVASGIAGGISSNSSVITDKLGNWSTYGTVIYGMYEKFAYNDYSLWNSIGRNVAYGIANGISNNKSVITNAAQSAAQAAYDAAANELDINSPSKVFAWMGKMVDAGFAQGIEKNAGEVEDAAQGLSDIVEDTAMDTYGAIESIRIENDPPVSTHEASGRALAQTQIAPNDITINVYARQGQDERQIAREVQRQFVMWERQRQMAYV